MGIMQAAYRTYESYSIHSGIQEKDKEMLIPISHIVQKAQIEIEIDIDGSFKSAKALDKGENTIFPATPESAGRVGNAVAHPLCDQLCYLAPYGGEKYESYLSQLSEWADSDFSHEKVRAVRAYIQRGTILNNLFDAEIIKLDEAGVPEKKFDKYLVRWQVVPTPDRGNPACWKDTTLFDSYVKLYASKQFDVKRDVCMVSGETDILCKVHPKGILPVSYGAKLISTKDDSGFKYFGRFTDARQAYNVGYISSQKAHNALRWVAINAGVIIGGRTFVCWNPKGKPVPGKMMFGFKSEKQAEFISYKKDLLHTINGYRNKLEDTDDVVIAALDAATTGRLSVTYYNELKASDFLSRLENWYNSCSWKPRYFEEQTPHIKQIVECAFGTLRGEFIEASPEMLKEHVQQLMHCVIDCRPIPADIVRALVTKAGNLQIYKDRNREKMLVTTCAIVRKYINDKFKEGWTLALDTTNTDRSYLFGRLLTIAEQVERSTYDREESREPNAIRLQPIFTQRPLYAWKLIEEKLNPYYAQLSPGLRAYFKNMIGEVVGKLPPLSDSTLPKRLEDTYLLGYYHQRTVLTTKKTNNTEDKNNESEE